MNNKFFQFSNFSTVSKVEYSNEQSYAWCYPRSLSRKAKKCGNFSKGGPGKIPKLMGTERF